MNYKLFKLLVIFFCITNSPAIFQTIINNIFWNLIVEGTMIVYLDNILIFIQTLEEYYKAIYRIMKVLAKHKLFLDPKKYNSNKQQIK